MGFAYFIVNLVAYGGPLLLTAGLTAALALTVFAGMPARWVLALGVAIALSCVPVAWKRHQLEKDVEALVQDEVWPANLVLEPGALLHLEPSNHAGLTCGRSCFDERAKFMTHVDTDEPARVFSWTSSEQLGVEDLWDAIEAPDRSEPFPYKYLFLSTDAWRLSGPGDDNSYRKPHWPKSIQGVHMLVSIPETGVVDFDTAQVHYRRFNVQYEVPEYPYWGFVTKTQNKPYVDEIVSDLVALQPQ
jgi:hypothetical protein